MRVLLVDDDSAFLDQAEKFLKEHIDDLKITKAENGENAFEIFREKRHDAVVSDQGMPDMKGTDLLKKVREIDSSVPFLMFSGEIDGRTAVDAINLGADRYILKKSDSKETYSKLAKALRDEVEHRKTAERLIELNSLLVSVRKINRLFIEEKNISSLMQKSAETLLETGGYLNVEIALAESSNDWIEPFASSGKHEHWQWKTKPDEEGNAPECVKRVLSGGSSLVFNGRKNFCDVCPYPDEDIDHHTVIVPMRSEGEIFGLLIVCHKPDRMMSDEEIELLEDVAKDLSFARKKILAEKKLEEERDLFVEGSTILFKWKAEDGYPIEYVTPNVENILGYSQEEMMSGDINYSDILPERDFKQVLREVERQLSTGGERIDHRPYRIQKKNGERIWVKDYTKIVRDEDRDVKYYLGYLVDITKQKQTEEALQKSEERYRRLFETAKDGILILNSGSGEIMDANPYIRDILGYSLDELQEKKLWDIGSFAQIVKNRKRFEKLREKEYVRYEDIPLETKDGKKVPVEFVSNVYKAGGEEVIQCNIREISKRKEAERKLEKKHNLIQNLLANAPGMAYRCLNDQYYTMKFLSQGCKKLTGYDQEDIMNNEKVSFAELILPEDRERVRSEIDQSVEDDERYQITYRIKTAEGGIKWVWERGKAVEDEDGEIYLEGIITDITERKEAIERQRFYHTVLRHDVGNKIQTLKGYLTLLKEKYGDEELVDKAKKVLDETRDIIEKVEKLENVEQKREIQDIYPKQIIEHCLSKHEPYLEDIDVDLEVEKNDLQVRADELLETLFSNLLENSIRHSDCDRIKISVLPKGDEVLILFEDNGVGIPDEKKEKILERGFKEGENAGSGLGVYLVKKIVDNYGGRLEIKDSELGGARFDILLKKA